MTSPAEGSAPPEIASPPAGSAARVHLTGLQRSDPVRWNYVLHVLGGGSLIMALQFGNPRLVLPWISHHLAVPYILVALLIPLYQVGVVASQLMIAPQIVRWALRKRVVAGTGLLLALLFAVIFAAAARLAPELAALALLACAASFGMSFGVYNVSSADLLAKTVTGGVRGRVLAQRTALGGLLTLGVTFAIWVFVPAVAGNHLILLWLAVGAWLGAAAAHGAIRELPSEPAPGTAGMISLRRGAALIRDHPWFARFLVLRGLLLSVELAVPFYAIHAASLHAPTARNLSAFVVAISFGLVLSGPLWGRLTDRHSALVTAAGALLAAAAGVLVLVLDQLGDPTAPFLHAFLFVPLSMARSGVIQARTRRLSVKAPAADRPAMVGLSNALLACVAVVVALLVGAAGHLHDIRTPLVILILFNIAAALYARRAFMD